MLRCVPLWNNSRAQTQASHTIISGCHPPSNQVVNCFDLNWSFVDQFNFGVISQIGSWESSQSPCWPFQAAQAPECSGYWTWRETGSMQSFDKNPSIQAPWWILMIVCVRRRDMMVWSVNALIVVMMDGQCLFEHAWSTQQPSTMDHAGPFLYMISTSSKKILGMSLKISNFLITAFRPSLIFSYMWINPTYMIWICFSASWSATQQCQKSFVYSGTISKTMFSMHLEVWERTMTLLMWPLPVMMDIRWKRTRWSWHPQVQFFQDILRNTNRLYQQMQIDYLHLSVRTAVWVHYMVLLLQFGVMLMYLYYLSPPNK